MNAQQTIENWIDEHANELIELLTELVAAKTVNPPGNEIEAIAPLKAFFERYAINYTTHEAEPGRTNLLATIGNKRPVLLMAGHVDVVPAGDGWTVPPFEATFKNGLVYGRGVSDNKGPTAAVALAGACIKSCFELNGTLIVAGVADEERGSDLGLEWLLQEKLLEVDAAIIPDIAGHMRKIDVAEKGLLHVRITSYGKQAHGSTPEKGINAIWNLISALNIIRERGIPTGEHDLLSATTCSLGQINGGVAPNIVPGSASAILDIRFLPDQTADDLLEYLQKILDEVSDEIKDARFELETISTLPPAEVAPDNNLVKLIQGAVKDVTCRDAMAIGIGGTTVAKQLIMRGISAVGFGVGDHDVAHMADEHIEVDELVRFAKVMALVAFRFFNPTEIQ